ARAAHQNSDGDADDGRECEAGEETQDGFNRVMRQNAGRGQAHERGGDFLERGKQAAWEKSRVRHDFPKRAHDQKRKQIAREDAPSALPAGGERSGGGRYRYVGHESLTLRQRKRAGRNRPARRIHSTVAPEAFTIGAHFSVSCLITRLKSSGVPLSGVPPS